MSDNHDQRNAEIWSTRVQRELLALTTDNAPEQDKKDTQGVLPPFMTVKEHQLDIGAGTCVVSFLVEITGPRHRTTPKSSPASSPTKQPAEGDEAEGGEEATETTTEESAAGDSTTATTDEKAIVTITLDASLGKHADGTLDTAAPAYPFLPPMAFIAEGASQFPEGSTLQDGDPVAIDCDWTPSLHLSDAVLNIGLKIKESILQQEPFHPALPSEDDRDPLDDVISGARAIGDKIGKFSRGLVPKKKPKAKKTSNKPPAVPGEVRIGDEINLLEPPWVEAQGIYSCKAVRRPEFVEAAIRHAALESGENVSHQQTTVYYLYIFHVVVPLNMFEARYLVQDIMALHTMSRLANYLSFHLFFSL